MSERQGPLRDPYAAPDGAAAPGTPRTSQLAVASLVSAVLGFVCVPALGGLLGVALGFTARSEIQNSEGRLHGQRLAWSGIALGTLNLLAFVLIFAVGFYFGFGPSTPSPAKPSPIAIAPPVPVAPPTALPGLPPGAPAPPTASGKSPVTSSSDDDLLVTRIGALTLVDLPPSGGSLIRQLDAQRSEASAKSEVVVLWVVTPDCKPCNGVAGSLTDSRMQAALKDVRLVRVDARRYAGELSYLSVPIQKIPGFAKLGSGQRPVDYVHGGEWDEDIPRNIAPVLGAFVRGKYRTRRDPWKGIPRDDETTL